MNKTKSEAIQKLIDEKRKNNVWMADMQIDDKGNICRTIENVVLFLENHPSYMGKLQYNEFLQQEEICGQAISDSDIAEIYYNCEMCLGFSTHTIIDDALSVVIYRHSYNPVIDYLENTCWDGVSRIETIFCKLFEVEDNELNRSIMLKWFVAAVKRAYEPGCKFDNILVLQGGQGIGKSTFCEKISKGFNAQVSLEDLGNKDLCDKLNKTWVAIIDELDGFGKKDMQKIKSFLSMSEDMARLAYKHYTKTFKRHCVFIGSTNDDTFLRDNTSSVERRFWVLKCNKTTMDSAVSDYLTDEMVSQLWAEAVYVYKNKPIYLDIDKSLFKQFEEEQSQFKTYQTDESTEWANDVLNREYTINSTGCFTDANDFFNQVNGSTTYGDTLFKQKINKIPGSWLCQVLKRNYAINISQKSLGIALSKDWEFKVIKYGDVSVRGFYRKNQENSNNKSNEVTHEELPF